MYREAWDFELGLSCEELEIWGRTFGPDLVTSGKKQTFLFPSYGDTGLQDQLFFQPTNQKTTGWVQSETETFWRRLGGNMESGPGLCPSPGNEKADYLCLSGVGATWLTTSLENRLLSSSGPYNSLHLMWVCELWGVRITLKGGWHHNRTQIFRHIWRHSVFFCVFCATAGKR